MKAFSEYLDTLDSLLQIQSDCIDATNLASSIDAALDGQPASALRRLVPLKEIRASGAFFTGSKLTQFALENLLPTINNDSIILDPACGAGDLLVACAAMLPRTKDINSTIRYWNSRLIGRDIHTEFIQATKKRLLLAVIRSGVNYLKHSPVILNELLPEIKAGCGLSDVSIFKGVTHIVTNPPFTIVDAPENCSWGSGKVNSAAIFMEIIVTNAEPNTRIVAVLPDVLRSGSRYEKWRSLIEKWAKVDRIKLYGQFDTFADVDVFTLELVCGNHMPHFQNKWHLPSLVAFDCIGNRFKIRVGPVVDYRDPHEGFWYPFIKARNLSPWQTIKEIEGRRRFSKTVIRPPFVVVRRTSRPGDKHRAVGTMITGHNPIAVENHLIVLIPNDGSEKSCRELLKNLNNSRTTLWLDERIRCRHLTVSSMAEIPWWEVNCD